MIRRQMDRPTPMPSSLVDTNGENNPASTSGITPTPVSATLINAIPLLAVADMVRILCLCWPFIASTAFRTRFTITC